MVTLSNSVVASIGRTLRGLGKRRGIRIAIILCLTFTVFINSIISTRRRRLHIRILCEQAMVRHPNARKHHGRQLENPDCATYWPQGTGELVPWEQNFPPLTHVNNGNTIWPTSNIAYAVSFGDCPDADHVTVTVTDFQTETSTGTTGSSTTVTPAFADTAAIMKHSIACFLPSSVSSYPPNAPLELTLGTSNIAENIEFESTSTSTVTSPNTLTTSTTTITDTSLNPFISDTGTMYAILPSDGVTCKSREGVDYDRASVLQNLGYWVKIWDPPVTTDSIVDQHFIASAITENAGFNDLAKLHALNLVNHEFVVVLDQNFILKKPLDDVLTTLRNSDDVAAYVKSPETGNIDSAILILKPNETTFDEIVDAYHTVPYTNGGGWDDTGIKGLDTNGILTYFLDNPDQVNGIELDRCIYANNADNECNQAKYDDVVGYSLSNDICGQPWMCTYDLLQVGWSDETIVMCDTFLMHWVQLRMDFAEQSFNQPISDNIGQNHVEIYHGLCTGVGADNYIPLVDQLPELVNCIDGSSEFHGCDPNYSSSTVTPLGSGAQLEFNVQFPSQCEVFIAEANNKGAAIPFSGTIEIVQDGIGVADTSMVFVIDRSGSTCDEESLGCSGDENLDLQHDDILDCEIFAILGLIDKVRSEGTVSHVGLVSFSSELIDIQKATIELPLTDIHDFDGNLVHAIENSIRGIACGGATNYAAAVEKACEVMDGSTTPNNVVIFISDGLPTRGGSPAAFCANDANFHTIALGQDAKCASGRDTSLQEIASSTGGTCQEVEHIPDITTILKDIAEAQLTSLKGSAVASASSVNFGCEDVANFKSSIGFSCAFIGPLCETSFAGEDYADSLGNTGQSACCVCGGGIYLNVGDLAQTDATDLVGSENSLAASTYHDSAVMHPGEHTVCTTATGLAGGVPGANIQCRNILVCPHPDDY